MCDEVRAEWGAALSDDSDEGWLKESDSEWYGMNSVDNVSIFYLIVSCINLFSGITYRVYVLIRLIIYGIVDC